ncbi:MAG TPA: sulfotransferase [Stellaceae bacterium]|nr:sulfotransferase [Stellaceae bacterium]
MREASVLFDNGRFSEAERLYEAILADAPRQFDALMRLATLRMQDGRLDSAIALLETAVNRNGASAEAVSALATALQLCQRYDEAIDAYDSAILLDPARAEPHYGLATVMTVQRRWDEAIACYRRALAIDPEYAEASCGLGTVLRLLGRHHEAIASFDRALAVDPDYADALLGRALALQAQMRHAEAVPCFERVLANDGGHAEAHLGLGASLQALDRYADAISHYEKALSIRPDHADARVTLGSALEELGRVAEAVDAYETAIKTAPRNARAYFALANAKPTAPGDRHVAAMEALLRDERALTPDSQIQLRFALAKALSDLGQDEQSFSHLLVGNALKRRTIDYDESAAISLFARIREVFTAELLASRDGAGHPSPIPVFIVGMPRSGSTLVEQILASHPRAAAVGERLDFRDAVRRVGGDSAAAPFPESVRVLNDERLRALGASYVTAIEAAAARLAGERRRAPRKIIDKTLVNFCFLGLIRLALPGARIIHTQRDPIDTCLSCFSKLFASEQSFAYDLGELGRYYRAYASLMEHWRAVLPGEVILDVQYEALVEDVAGQARRLVAHCGLDWDDACLAFHETKRPVKTASVAQVRRPIYRSSVGRWRPSEAVLRPLIEGLGPECMLKSGRPS